MYSPSAAIALLLTSSLLSFMVSISYETMSISASSLSIMVLCLIRRPTTEQTLIFIIGDLICSSIRLRRAMNTLLIKLLLTFELIIMLSKYWRAQIFSLIVVLFAIELYTSDKWFSIS